MIQIVILHAWCFSVKIRYVSVTFHVSKSIANRACFFRQQNLQRRTNVFLGSLYARNSILMFITEICTALNNNWLYSFQM
jgi:hypothetical protein